MPMNNNPTPNNNKNSTPSQDVSPQRTTLVPIAIALVIALVIGVIGYTYFFSGDIPTN